MFARARKILDWLHGLFSRIEKAAPESAAAEQPQAEMQPEPQSEPASDFCLDDKIQQASTHECYHVLVVHEKEEVISMLKEKLGETYRLTCTPDYRAALKILAENQVDVVISGYTMPTLSGLDFLRLVRKSTKPDVLFIILTTIDTLEARVQALQAGVDDYMVVAETQDYVGVRISNMIAQRQAVELIYQERLLRLEPRKSGKHEPDDTFLMRLVTYMDQQMDNSELTVEEMVAHMAMGRTVFFTRLKSITGLSPVEFIREMRIKRAAQLLEDGTYTVSEVAYMIGMTDSRYFAKCFKATYGMTPTEYKRSHIYRKKDAK